MKKVVIFLDFDGVFHPLMGGLLKFIDLPNFENKFQEREMEIFQQLLDQV